MARRTRALDSTRRKTLIDKKRKIGGMCIDCGTDINIAEYPFMRCPYCGGTLSKYDNPRWPQTYIHIP